MPACFTTRAHLAVPASINRPSVSRAMVGSEVAARAPADGYTLLGREQAVLAAHPSLPAKNVRELIALAESAECAAIGRG